MGLLLLGSQLNAQKSAVLNEKVPGLQKAEQFVGNVTGDCDTLPVPADWDGHLVIYSTSAGGYVSGPNGYASLGNASYFDLSATSYTYITGADFYFAYANSNKSGNLNKTVNFKVYDGSTGAPGALLGDSLSSTLGAMKAFVDAGTYATIEFPAPIALPASKKIFISFEYPNLVWSTSPLGSRDSLGLVTSDDQVTEYADLWTYWGAGEGWGSVDVEYGGLPIGGVIFPFVSTSETGCSVMPVRLLSFDAVRNNNDVTLTWKIADEMNMGHYEVERADNNGQFKTVATVDALNMLKEQTYTVTDKNAFNTASTVQYRLKQVDGDGTINYSSTVNVKAAGLITDVVFQNPINSKLKIQLNLASAQNVSVSLYNLQGSLVSSVKNKMCNASANTIEMDASHLQSGMYILKINAGTEQVVYKVVKQ